MRKQTYLHQQTLIINELKMDKSDILQFVILRSIFVIESDNSIVSTTQLILVSSCND
uniref:Uncharacterized protein n=1 Tax=Arion vulgaris TaxID=1028688 RepID=A0A0B6YII9_9EUPU